MPPTAKRKSRVLVVDGKRWVPSLFDWSWIVTVAWMAVANVWKPFGLFGFVCFLTPIAIALSGRGKMHCARVCPRGSLIQHIGQAVNLGLPRPKLYAKRGFRVAVWAVVMGAFITVLAVFAPQGVDALGNGILVFMEVMTVVAIANGVLFKPRTWCTICPMGFTTFNLKNALRNATS